jgi:hypothetical protein
MIYEGLNNLTVLIELFCPSQSSYSVARNFFAASASAPRRKESAHPSSCVFTALFFTLRRPFSQASH